MFKSLPERFKDGWIYTGITIAIPLAMLGGMLIQEDRGIKRVEAAVQEFHSAKATASAAEAAFASFVSLLPSMVIFVTIMAVDLVVLWLLANRFGHASRNVSADTGQFDGKLKWKSDSMSGKITVAAAGALGSFLTLFVVTVGAVIILKRFL